MPIEGVGTAVAAFVGFTERYDAEQGDPTDPAGVKPQLVTSWPQYERVYGGFVRGAMLPHAVRGFFENGGSAAYICRIPGANGSNGSAGVPTAVLPTAENPQTPSLQLTARHQVATPVNWKSGEDVIIVPAVSDEAAREKYPEGWTTLKPYLRIVPQPRD